MHDHWLAVFTVSIYNHYLPPRFKVCKFAGRFKCFAPSSPIWLSVIGLSKTYVTSQLLIYLSFYYTHSHSLYWLPCMIIDWLYLLFEYNYYLQRRSKVCKFPGSFKCFAPSAPIPLSIIEMSKTYVTSQLLIYIYQSSIIHIVIHCIDFHVYDHWLALFTA